ncbi:TPA: hypothetical protein SMH10_001413 [Klebsiella oxytoca]|jgi:hypothetical protein|nr:MULTISPECIES: hypothetical protein [Klebsiella]MBF8473704.1 hypothetical protein [Klebsiella michiganensis]MBZ6603952.1 hypothetical protein [Klebsiella michiganensis]QRS58054.1 hypothetical protein I6K62_14135 [Klebsiella oxytoca]RWT36132.1 hypothetical protein DN619_31920 [Klebsiella michiganensis]HEJ7613997.1 hypothetical protein [Klebsiella oxytoca]
MINKRGLSPAEFETIDPDLFNALMVYDTYIEPSGTKIDMLFHSNLCHSITMNNPGMTKEVAKSIKITDYDFLGILDDSKTTKERYNERLKLQQDKEERDIKSMGEIIKTLAQAKGKNKDGKKK